MTMASTPHKCGDCGKIFDDYMQWYLHRQSKECHKK